MSGYITDACNKGGDGQCDGFGAGGQWCECECHTDDDLPITVDGVRIWHEQMWEDA